MRDKVESLVSSFLGLNVDEHPDEAAIEAKLRTIAEVFSYSDVTDDEFIQAAEEIKNRIAIRTDFGSVLRSVDHKPWLDDKRDQIGWEHFKAYKTVLQNEFHLAPKVIQNLDEMTDLMLDLVGDPEAPGSWHRKGLVIGNVQSGKTSNIVGLLNKAADAGYKLFIVIGGHTTPLRSQTQVRIDQGFTGQDTKDLDQSVATASGRKTIGVGEYWAKPVKVQSFTTEKRDFSSILMRSQNYQLTSDMAHPVVLVVKKNARVLQNINKWLAMQSVREMPLLVIDDESDYASVNTKREDQDPTSVNREIRRMLSLSAKSTYVAFTATPFANILIDVEATHVVEETELEDLFPRNFIVALNSPSNYVGPEEIFGRPPKLSDALRLEVEDADDIFPVTQKSGLAVEELPESLHRAVSTFFSAAVVRATRGDGDERKSMMINVSHFVDVQIQTYELVSKLVGNIKRESAFCLSDQGELNKEAPALEEIWEAATSEYGFKISQKKSFLRELKSQIEQTTVQVRNSRVESDVEQSINTVVIGGHVLSRGLTLSGLIVSYFLRSGSAMDSLLQMGRWFGYHDRYEDLVRIWMRKEVADWFTKIADVVEDVLFQIREMNRKNSSPEHFGLRIRLHPGRLRVTAPSKARAATEMRVDVSLAGFSYETSSINEANFSKNWSAMWSLLTGIEESGYEVDSDLATGGGRNVYRGVSGDLVSKFLQDFQFQNSPLGSLAPMTRKFADQNSNVVFDVAISEGNFRELLSLPGGLAVRPVSRRLSKGEGGTFFVTEQRRVAAAGDLVRSMRVQDRNLLIQEYGDTKKEAAARSCLTAPILTLFPVMDNSGEVNEPVVAYSLHFPAARPEDTVSAESFTSYLYNAVAFKQAELFDWDSLEEEEGEDGDE